MSSQTAMVSGSANIRSLKQSKTTSNLIPKFVQKRNSAFPFQTEMPDIQKKSSLRDNKNIITIKGRTYKRADVLGFKRYFDDIDELKTGKMRLEDYVKSVQNSSHLKRIAVSLYNYLDKDGKGEVSFEQMLYRITPGATKRDITKMLKWIKEEEQTQAKGVINYKLPKYVVKRDKRTLTFNQIKDFLHIFVELDDDHSNTLS